MCGVFGIFGHPEAAHLAYLGLHALQHRGQESAGIVSSDGQRLYVHRAMGLVQAGFSAKDLAGLPGDRAIGHVRYSTAGASHIRNAQPIAVDYARGSVALAHNGNLTNHDQIRERLEARGSIFVSTTDTESVVHLIAMSSAQNIEGRIVDALQQIEGAYSLLFLTERELVAVRDPMGFRPLCIGELHQDGKTAHVIASEPTAFDLIGAKRLRDVEPGEMVIVTDAGIRSIRPLAAQPRRMCLFEYVYFARPDARIDGASVYEVRKSLGQRLAEEHPIAGPIDDVVVIPVPDSGVPAAIGLARQAGAPFEVGLIRSHYVGRTFIEPQQSIRHFGVRMKLHPNRPVIEGKRVVVVDDSIVRGTTSRKIVKMLRDAGAREVHVRISSPPVSWPCYYGIDTPTRAELIASNHSTQEIARYLRADSLGYLSLDGLIDAVRAIESSGKASPDAARDVYCHACFSGDYPVPLRPHSSTKPNPLRMVAQTPDAFAALSERADGSWETTR